MGKRSNALGNSRAELEQLRAVAVWAADCAELALPIFEQRHPTDTRPREAIAAGLEFGQGSRRDHNLRVVALSSLKAGKVEDEPSKFAARAATLTAAVAYTHTDLQTGVQGVRQAQHILGPAVYAALALETAANGDTNVGDEIIRRSVETAPLQVRYILSHLPPQPKGKNRLSALFFNLDTALRGE